jgi:MFS family permease
MPAALTVFGVVARNRDLRNVALAFVGFNAAEWSTWIAILVYAYGVGGPTAVGVVSLVLLVPSALVAPIAAQAGDRFPRKRVLIVGYLVQAITAGATGIGLLLAAPPLVVYALAAVATMSVTLTRPTQGALLPQLAGSTGELVAANAVLGAIENVSIFAGPAVTAVLLGVSSPGVVWVVMASVTLVSALFANRVRGGREAEAMPGPGDDGLLTNSIKGFRFIARARGPRLIVGLMFALSVELGSLDVLLVVLGLQLLRVGRSGTGFLFAAIGAGGIAGIAVTASLVGRRRLAPAFLAGIVVWAAAMCLIGLFPGTLNAIVLLGLAGAGRNLMDVAGRTLLQRTVAEDVLTRVFGVLEGLYNGSIGLGAILAPLVIAAFTIRGAFIVAGAALVVVALLALRPLVRIDATSSVPQGAVERLHALPLFRPLSGTVVERLAEAVVRLSFPAGAVIIAAGEVGDRFYIIDRGEVAVTRDGHEVARLGSGESFGEIALLRGIPRTATVTARSDVEVLALAAEPFLRAVTGNPRARRAAETVVASRLPEESGGSQH